MKERRKWSSAAKFEIALLAIKGETTLAEICQRYQITPSLVHAWRKQLLEQGSQLFNQQDKATKQNAAEKECTERLLYEKIGELTVERDFLKKAWGKLHGPNDGS